MAAPQAPAPEAPPAPEDGYRNLSVNAVLADLASLDTDQLLLVKSLEEAGDRRTVILDRIEDLLVVQEATHHVRQAAPAPAPAPAPTPPPPTPPRRRPVARGKPVSSDLVNQMGSLLARDDARRSPDPTFAGAPLPPAPPAGPAAQSGLIMPKRRRMSRAASHHGRVAKILVVVIILALLGAVAGVFWKQSQKATNAASPPPAGPAAENLPDLIVATVSGSFTVTSGSGPNAAASVPAASGFVSGYHRDWNATAGQGSASVNLNQFQSAADATAAAKASVALTDRGLTVTQNPGGITGATGLTGTGATTDAWVIFPKGIFQVTVMVQGPRASVAAQADSVAQAENALLPQ